MSVLMTMEGKGSKGVDVEEFIFVSFAILIFTGDEVVDEFVDDDAEVDAEGEFGRGREISGKTSSTLDDSD